ncbi:MAG: M28 family peptidase [Candidatus Bathyarchaeota archaeon]|nr:M28 family peptidase [Candidatus Bathyarchaeota archaeon]
MIILTDETKKLIKKLEKGINKDLMQANWEAMMEFAPMHSGSQEEEQAVQFMKQKFEEYGLETKVHRFEAYISDPKFSSLKIISPIDLEVQCTPYRQVGTTTPEGFEAEMIYIPPDEIGYAECRDKIVLCEQRTSGDWMGLRADFLLRLQKMGLKALVVIEQDDYMPTVVHQRADFSVSGSPTPDNIDKIHTIPAILHISNKDGQALKKLVKQGEVKAHIVSIMDTGWKTLPLLETEIRGTVEPEKFILVNAHVDTPPFSPGVVDNLSGNVAVMELARLINNHKDKLRRSIRIAIWAGHEIGRYAGSTWYNDAMWNELRHNCTASYNIDSPGAEGASKFRAVQITEVMDAAQDTIESVQGHKVDNLRWATRAGDGSFWGTGMPHVSITTSRPPELYDPHVNYSGGGWWWHTPYATMDHGDVDVLEMDVKAELGFILRMTNCPVLPYNFTGYAEKLLSILVEMQEKANKVRAYFNLYPVIERAMDFKKLSAELEEAIKRKAKSLNEDEIKELNEALMWISRHVNPVAHSNAGPSEQMTMETFGALPFPRIAGIIDLANMTLHQSHEFKLLQNKLQRQRNIVEEGFYQANKLIETTLAKLK